VLTLLSHFERKFSQQVQSWQACRRREQRVVVSREVDDEFVHARFFITYWVDSCTVDDRQISVQSLVCADVLDATHEKTTDEFAIAKTLT